ncbi:carbohydrate ABC transporter permease [Occultella glacieicola]|uniref:Carbohydrate ABC transporter permease n=1 Tax=Occultella glacieicola TaxID=2518684 RepID=A0ABY2E2X2_9MICO|nr:carbohydrate ABC transporter permease [Occultella glacieicola]TDE93974.1 carbohydrate ABC transporter permease [Occultella glacieicola]
MSATQARTRTRTEAGPGTRRRPSSGILPTAVLLIGAAYCLLPVYWLISAATKRPDELFSTFSLAPSFNGGFLDNLVGLSQYAGGAFWQWCLNSVIYAGGGAVAATAVAALAGFALAKYEFPGKRLVFGYLLVGVLVPGVIVAIPQYLLLSQLGLAGTRWSILLPAMISPFSIYLTRVFTAGAVSDEVIESARLDGAREFRLFRSVALPMMVPGLITVFLLQFVGIWNNFLLPFIMVTRSDMMPLTVGFYSMMNQGSDQTNVYSFVIMGCLLAVVPLIALFLFLQRYWRLDLISGSLKG